MKNTKRILTILFVLLSSVASLSLQADTIFLRSGQWVRGNIISQDRSKITVNTENGHRDILKTSIRRIVFGAEEKSTMASDEEKKVQEEKLAAMAKEREEREKAAAKQREEEEIRRREEAARQEAARQEALKKQQDANGNPVDGRRITTLGAVWRSALLPGWGQSYEGRKSAGYKFGGGFLSLFVLTFYFRSQSLSSRETYSQNADMLFAVGAAAPSPYYILGAAALYPQTADSRQRMQTWGNRTNFLGTALFGLYIWNLVDVVLYRPTAQTAVAILPVGDGLRLSWIYQF